MFKFSFMPFATMYKKRLKPIPWTYFLIRLLFKFVLKVFYGTIVVENEEYIPLDGKPCILCCNHGNSLTDPLMLVRSIPSKTRNMVRLTAKDTLFGKPNFSSWLIEASGALPIKRQKDHGENKVDNSQVMEILMKALEGGDMVCLFPEGLSRYHPKLAPLKTGVARIVSDVLTRNRSNPDFELTILTCSMTYMHREHFRSDVLVSFNPPIALKVKDHPRLLAPADFNAIKELTSTLQAQISLGTIDAPSWEIVKIAKTATRLYAPLGTRMSLGDYVRVLRTFVDAFTAAVQPIGTMSANARPMSNEEPELSTETETEGPSEMRDLMQGLQAYQNKLNRFGLNDDRIRRPIHRPLILPRLLIRLSWLSVLFVISIPGLILFTPIFITVNRAVKNVKRSGKPSEKWDEIAETKLLYGLVSGLSVWIVCILLTIPLASITAISIPIVMWLTVRWLEDGISAFRACMALSRLLWISKPELRLALREREILLKAVMGVAHDMGLPDDPETYFTRDTGRQRGQVKGRWDSGTRYFSLRRRRKRDWNEVLRLYDKVDYPDAS